MFNPKNQGYIKEYFSKLLEFGSKFIISTLKLSMYGYIIKYKGVSLISDCLHTTKSLSFMFLFIFKVINALAVLKFVSGVISSIFTFSNFFMFAKINAFLRLLIVDSAFSCEAKSFIFSINALYFSH